MSRPSIRPPRPRLSSRAPRFMRATAAASIRPAVSGVRVACRLTTSARTSSSSSGSRATPAACASAALTNGSLVTTVEAERQREPGQGAPDVAEADDAEHGAFDVAGDQLVARRPVAGAHLPVPVEHLLEQHQRQGQGALRHRARVGAGGVDHRDAALGGGRHIDAVHADAGAPDHAQVRRRVDHRAGDLGLAAAHDGHRVGGVIDERALLDVGSLHRGSERPEGVAHQRVDRTGDHDARHGC